MKKRIFSHFLESGNRKPDVKPEADGDTSGPADTFWRRLVESFAKFQLILLLITLSPRSEEL
jgi:hypothetical protein